MNWSQRNTIVTASAGTGKTYRLVTEFAETVLASIPPERILALTFTEKAAAEMKTRIADRLATGRYLRELEQAPIATYHSFCARVLREYAGVIGLEPNFALLDPFEEEELASQIAKKIILQRLQHGEVFVQTLVARFQVKGLAENLLRISQQMMESGCEPDAVVDSPVPRPFTLIRSENFVELTIRCKRALVAYDEIWASLTEVARERISSARALLSQLQGVIESEESLEIRVSSIFSSLKEALGGRFGPDALRRNVLAEVFALGTLICESFLAPETFAFKSLLSEFSVELASAKKQRMSLAFGDLLVLTRKLLRENLVARKDLKNRFDRVLVDEYQDTSPIQEEIVALLCEANSDEIVLESGMKAIDHVVLEQGKLFVVGDPKQSIYGFRGSDATLFDRMRRVIVEQGGDCESLAISRRSAPGVIRVVNQATSCDEKEKLIPLREETGDCGAIVALPRDAIAKLIAEGVKPGSIAILVRRIKKATAILEELAAANIPAQIWGGDGFFECQEVVEIICALRLAIEPTHSVSLLTVMRSPLMSFDDFYWPHFFEAQNGFTVDAWLAIANSEQFPKELRQRTNCFLETHNWIVSRIDKVSAVEAFEKIIETNGYYDCLEPSSQANVDKLRGLLIELDGNLEAQVKQMVRWIKRVPKEALAEEDGGLDAVRIMTIHQSKGLEFPVVFVADMSAGIPSDASDFLFDEEFGLALNYRGRPISVCAPEGDWAEQFPTRIQAVRARKRAKEEEELSRLLYVALTRARDQIYIVDDRERDENGKVALRGTTLLSLFMSRARDSLSDRLCERSEANHALQESRKLDCFPLRSAHGRNDENPHCDTRKLFFASDIFATRAEPETRAERLTYQRPIPASGPLTPSEAGTLAHKMIRMAAEQLAMHEYSDVMAMREVLASSLRVLGRVQPNEDLIDSCVTTLETVVWPLMKSEFEIQFEVPMRLEVEDYVIKGFSDLIATRGDIACLVDFKSSQAVADSEKAKVQLLSYCASLRTKYERIFYSTYVIGSSDNLDFIPFDEDEYNYLTSQLLTVQV